MEMEFKKRLLNLNVPRWIGQGYLSVVPNFEASEGYGWRRSIRSNKGSEEERLRINGKMSNKKRCNN